MTENFLKRKPPTQLQFNFYRRSQELNFFYKNVCHRPRVVLLNSLSSYTIDRVKALCYSNTRIDQNDKVERHLKVFRRRWRNDGLRTFRAFLSCEVLWKFYFEDFKKNIYRWKTFKVRRELRVFMHISKCSKLEDLRDVFEFLEKKNISKVFRWRWRCWITRKFYELSLSTQLCTWHELIFLW